MNNVRFILSSLLVSFALTLKAADTDIPRPEYPRPQFERNEWMNLNGKWSYTFDFSRSGREQGWARSKGFDKLIVVPFCPESKLSGVGHTDFVEQMWYHRTITVPAEWEEKQILLHFGAVDYYAEIYLDGKQIGNHYGGTSSFTIDLTPYAKAGNTHDLVVRVVDEVRRGVQPSGKQSPLPQSFGPMYSRVTGIWQTVWMEAVSPYGLKSTATYPDIDQQQLVIQPQFYQTATGGELEIEIYDADKKVVAKENTACANGSYIVIPFKKMKLWTPETPYLYDIVYRVKDAEGNVCDEVKSYVGMRKVHTADGMLYLNNEPYFQRLVLQQGYYPDGIWLHLPTSNCDRTSS